MWVAWVHIVRISTLFPPPFGPYVYVPLPNPPPWTRMNLADVWSSNEIMSATIFLDLPHCKGDFMAFADCEKNLLYVQRERGKKKKLRMELDASTMLHSTTSLLFFLRCIP